jgi:peptide deformylase
MSDIITFNTEDAVKKEVVKPQQAEIFQLLREDHPILLEKMPQFDFDKPPVDPIKFASTLVDTCKYYRGYGLSANQCGFKYNVFVMGTNDDYVAFYNPKIVSSKGEIHLAEGCLSFPLLGLHITRAEMIDIEYQDYNGVLRQATYSGISARCFQHELDHMHGIVYTQRVKPMALQMGIKKRNKLMKKMRIK